MRTLDRKSRSRPDGNRETRFARPRKGCRSALGARARAPGVLVSVLSLLGRAIGQLHGARLRADGVTSPTHSRSDPAYGDLIVLPDRAEEQVGEGRSAVGRTRRDRESVAKQHAAHSSRVRK